MKISPARLASFEILRKIQQDQAFSSVLLPLFEKNLHEKDRALCHELTLGTLRRQIYLDNIIEKFVSKKLDAEVRIALRLGVYQIYFLDKIPLYSIINESVNLVQRVKKTSAKGLVNAVLRKIGAEKVELNLTEEVEKISVETSHPRWLVEKWIGQFGIEETLKLCVANNQTPDLQIRFTAKTSESVKQSVPQLSKKELLELSEKGEIYFQDRASQMVAEIIELKEDERFLDVCCAPGSKLSMIASRVEGQVLRVESENTTLNPQHPTPNFLIGGDLYFQRLQISKNSCLKQGVKNVQFVQYDAADSLPFADETFDVILLDAPCSGTGTIRHNPEIRYFLQKQDFAELFGKQLKILKNASKVLKKNGRLIYSTCSLEVEENEQVIEKFLGEQSGFQKVKPNLTDEFLTAENVARTFPQRDKMDGFFIATLKKC
jgi:16S rRNA (cytosine967-C5)-methyltransferase